MEMNNGFRLIHKMNCLGNIEGFEIIKSLVKELRRRNICVDNVVVESIGLDYAIITMNDLSYLFDNSEYLHGDVFSLAECNHIQGLVEGRPLRETPIYYRDCKGEHILYDGEKRDYELLRDVIDNKNNCIVHIFKDGEELCILDTKLNKVISFSNSTFKDVLLTQTGVQVLWLEREGTNSFINMTDKHLLYREVVTVYKDIINPVVYSRSDTGDLLVEAKLDRYILLANARQTETIDEVDTFYAKDNYMIGLLEGGEEIALARFCDLFYNIEFSYNWFDKGFKIDLSQVSDNPNRVICINDLGVSREYSLDSLLANKLYVHISYINDSEKASAQDIASLIDRSYGYKGIENNMIDYDLICYKFLYTYDKFTVLKDNYGKLYLYDNQQNRMYLKYPIQSINFLYNANTPLVDRYVLFLQDDRAYAINVGTNIVNELQYFVENKGIVLFKFKNNNNLVLYSTVLNSTIQMSEDLGHVSEIVSTCLGDNLYMIQLKCLGNTYRVYSLDVKENTLTYKASYNYKQKFIDIGMFGDNLMFLLRNNLTSELTIACGGIKEHVNGYSPDNINTATSYLLANLSKQQ